MNTQFSLNERDRGRDTWSRPAALDRWLRNAQLISSSATTRIGQPELARALQVRNALRTLAASGHTSTGRVEALRQLNSAAAGAAVELRFAEGAVHFVQGSAGSFGEALGLILGITAGSMIDGRWSRLKICPGRHCGWAFYDSSRNRTGRWCSMSVCGSRAKARTHYRRRTAGLP